MNKLFSSVKTKVLGYSYNKNQNSETDYENMEVIDKLSDMMENFTERIINLDKTYKEKGQISRNGRIMNNGLYMR